MVRIEHFWSQVFSTFTIGIIGSISLVKSQCFSSWDP